MDGGERGRSARSFLIGSVVGAGAALATARRRRAVVARRGDRLEPPAGLAAFEGAPCFEELVEEQQRPPDASAAVTP